MDRKEAEAVAKDLKGLACIECTRKWLRDNQGLAKPIESIKEICSFGLITQGLQERLIAEIKTINKT